MLGDIVGYGADPDGVIARLKERDAVMIAGNHDLAATGGFDTKWFNEVASAAIDWTQGVLTPEAKAFLETLEPFLRRVRTT